MIYCREKYPEIHRFFGGIQPTSLQFQMMWFYIEVNGEKLYISPEIEDFFASGKNFEHSDGSVHQSKLELFFQVYKWWTSYIALCKKDGKPVVCSFVAFF